jgi:hypothetical protein
MICRHPTASPHLEIADGLLSAVMSSEYPFNYPNYPNNKPWYWNVVDLFNLEFHQLGGVFD